MFYLQISHFMVDGAQNNITMLRSLKPALQLRGIEFDATDHDIRYGMAWHPHDIELMHLTLPCIDASCTL